MNKTPFILYTKFHSLPEGAKSGFYPGVLVIEKGIAKGHYAAKDGTKVVAFDSENPEHKERFQITIAPDTLDDVVKCGNASPGGVKCKLDHGSTVRDMVGNYTNFSRDGDSVRADLTLLDSSPHRAFVEEIISKMSNKFGNSIDFNPSYEIRGSEAVARCKKLNSVDVVDSPAATNSFFEEDKDNPTPDTYMPLSKEDLEAIGGVVDTKLSAVKTEFSTSLAALNKRFEDGDAEKKVEDEKKKDDEDASEKMSEAVEKATLAAIEKVLPKAKLASLLSSPPAEKKDAFEEAVAAQLSAGAANRGVAIIRVAKDKPELYNEHRKNATL